MEQCPRTPMAPPILPPFPLRSSRHRTGDLPFQPLPDELPILHHLLPQLGQIRLAILIAIIQAPLFKLVVTFPTPTVFDCNGQTPQVAPHPSENLRDVRQHSDDRLSSCCDHVGSHGLLKLREGSPFALLLSLDTG
jgi:hypothetical protein